MDAKLLATIIAIAKKEAGTQARDLSVLERKVEDKLKEFHERSPILDTPSFTIKDGCLYCQWSSGLTLDFGNIVGPQGPQGTQGPQGVPGVAGKDGTNGKDGINGKDGQDGKDGEAAAAGRDGKDGKDGRMGPQGPRGAPGPVGLQGEAGKDGKDGLDGRTGPVGPIGIEGTDGVGIEKVWVDDRFHLTIRLTSGKVIDTGYVRGPAGINASKGGRASGGYSPGGGGGTSVRVVSAAYVGQNLILTMSDGSTIDAGAIPSTPSSSDLNWIDYVTNWATEPTLIGTTSEGDVYQYVYTTSTYYRLVPSEVSVEQDSFYETWNGSALSTLITSRSMNI